ncbi:hypothetical protein [Sphingobacterium corticibacter]|uniref:TonB-dependent receptor plug domain-containing protein n=1 Tax=Sphingobacterium corticibacter TaxID=2171749 RepID=A0A2T8HET6_9SPHI|nr:hypothetical protein [Sphingobacterium corticibacter]PVH23947.1 hypothetical protein DC487_15970 [Sphingobacterium corticibacter]
MKRIFAFLFLIIALNSLAQNADTIRLSDFQFCELTLEGLKQKDPSIKKVKVEEMDLCPDGFVEDGRFENRVGYISKLYPGVIFQKYQSDVDMIAKIHLTKAFKGYLPNGNYIDMSALKAVDILTRQAGLNAWTSRGCSDYWGIKEGEQIYYYVKINKDKKPQYPVDEKYYSEQPIVGIDIIADCYSYYEDDSQRNKPLFILDGKEVSEAAMQSIKPDDVDSINVIKDKNATDKYGEKGKNGVIEIFLKKKR